MTWHQDDPKIGQPERTCSTPSTTRCVLFVARMPVDTTAASLTAPACVAASVPITVTEPSSLSISMELTSALAYTASCR